MRDEPGLIEGARLYFSSVRENAARMQGAGKAGYCVACVLGYLPTAALIVGGSVVERLRSGGLERK